MFFVRQTARSVAWHLALLGLVVALVFSAACKSGAINGDDLVAALADRGGSSNIDALREFEEAAALWEKSDRTDHEGVRAHLERALREDERFGIAWFNLGIVDESAGDLQGARQSYNEAIKYAPRLGQAYVNLGMLELNGGDREAARTYFGKALEVQPDNRAARNNMSALREEARQEDGAFNYGRGAGCQGERALAQDAPHEAAERTLYAHLQEGLQQWEQGHRELALKTFQNILNIYEEFTEEEQAVMTEGRDAAAQAQFMIGEDLFAQAQKVRIDSAETEEVVEQVKEKYQALSDVQKIYQKVIAFERPGWAIAALYQIGRGIQDLGEVIRSSPMPPELTESQSEEYKGHLDDRVTEIERRAVEVYLVAFNAAWGADCFNAYSRLAVSELAELRPQEYQRLSESGSYLQFFREGFMSFGFITEVEEEDLLRDLGARGAESGAQGAPSES